ncbi:hypothetical protein [Aliarcobacter butzleri]|uniref:hypothetical protein n=1 Tax=Aliarcobacter butzleri TaxID=28197 RepID=UPI00263CBB85|nr:hypothetical protein [Aliarcobacter butzleri]MDN5049821.1 hypothetical protein [Aliarcobacter butzleri]MDN5056862.1 hypothetical protein [Aliarcobacter butzleri]
MNAMKLYNELEPTFKLIVQGYNLFDKYQTDKHRKIVTRFHRNILDGNESEEKIKYEQGNIKANQEDYFTLLKFALEDEEKEKVDIYTNIYKYIRDNQHLEINLKRFLLKAAKNIPFSAIEFLPKIYIHQKYHTKLKNLNDFLQSLYKSNGYETSILENYKLINSGRGSFGSTQYNISNKYFNLIIDAFFRKEDLLPKKYNIEIWKDKYVLILNNSSSNKEEPILMITDILNKNSIKYKIHPSTSIDLNPYSHIICLLTDLNHNIVDYDLYNNLKNSNFQSNPLIKKVTLSNNFPNSGVLNLNEEEDINKLKEMFSD